MGYAPTDSRTGIGNGDTVGYRSLARINLDARTQTGYGTLRAFTRLEFASRSGFTQGFRSSTQERIANAFGATGQDQAGRLQQFMNTDKAFIQFAGLTAGRASSFFDFYAHDFELQTATAGSDLQSTNLLAYSTKLGTSGFSATLSLEDPLYRRNTIYSQEFASPAQGLSAVAPLRVLVTTSPLGIPTFQTVDVSQRSRMPDFVGVLRYDAAWGSAQLSAAVKELNTGNFIAGSTVAGALTPGFALPAVGSTARPSSEYGWAVQGGVKVNLPFIARVTRSTSRVLMAKALPLTLASHPTMAPTPPRAQSSTVPPLIPTSRMPASTQSPVRSSSPRASASSARFCTTGVLSGARSIR